MQIVDILDVITALLLDIRPYLLNVDVAGGALHHGYNRPASDRQSHADNDHGEDEHVDEVAECHLRVEVDQTRYHDQCHAQQEVRQNSSEACFAGVSRVLVHLHDLLLLMSRSVGMLLSLMTLFVRDQRLLDLLIFYLLLCYCLKIAVAEGRVAVILEVPQLFTRVVVALP